MLTWECQQSVAAPEDICEILGCYTVVSIKRGNATLQLHSNVKLLALSRKEEARNFDGDRSKQGRVLLQLRSPLQEPLP